MCEGPHDFIPAANTAELRAIFDTPGGKAMNVTNWRKATPFDKDDLAALIDAYVTAWDAQFSPLQSTAVEMTRVIATDINSENSFQVDRAPAISVQGGLAEAPAPNNVTVATKFTTGHAGRSYRGRSYFIGMTDGQHTADQLEAGLADSITSAWTDLVGAIHDSDLGADLVIVSYCSDGAWRTDALVNPVTDISTENTIDSMRTRLSGRGI